MTTEEVCWACRGTGILKVNSPFDPDETAECPDCPRKNEACAYCGAEGSTKVVEGFWHCGSQRCRNAYLEGPPPQTKEVRR
jgi:hypothetical protein